MSAETLAAKLDALWLDLSDDRDIPVERARIMNALHDAAQALRTPPAPMEAVAWRFWHEGGWNFSSTDPSPHLADCVERDALAIIPAPAADEINWKAEWEAVSIKHIRLARAAQPFADVAIEFEVCGDGQPIGVKASSGRSDLCVGDLRALVQALAAHPPQPDALPGDLRETVARRMFDADSKENGLARDWMFEGGCHASYFAMADAILSLIQSERGGG